MLDEDYAAFTIFFGTKLLECEDCYFGMCFVDVHHDTFYGTDGNNYLGASCIFIHDFYLNIVLLKITLNKKTHGSEHNSENLEDRLKADYSFDFLKNARSVVTDKANSATKVDGYFFEDAEQVNCDIHHINSAMKYVFVLLENTRLTISD